MMLTSGCQDDNLTENLQFVHSEPNVRLADPLGSFCSIIYGSWAKVRKCTVGTSLETLSLPAVWRCYDRYYFCQQLYCLLKRNKIQNMKS